MDTQVGSYDEHKVTASREAIKSIFPRIPLSVNGNVVNQELNAQIEGKDEILAAAFHRLNKLKEKLAAEAIADQEKSEEIIAETRADLLLVMQDGIYSEIINGKLHWFNMAWVIAEDANGVQQCNPSAGIEIDEDIVEEARKVDLSRNRKGFENTTIGDIIAERAGPDADPTDPHNELTKSIVKRLNILSQTVKIAVGQLLMKSPLLQEIRSKAGSSK